MINTWWEGLLEQDGMGIPFICDSCKKTNHEECPGNTQCDCQHRGSSSNVEGK